jgi:hypothetical protein
MGSSFSYSESEHANAAFIDTRGLSFRKRAKNTGSEFVCENVSNPTEPGLEGKITASGEWKHDGLSTECSWWSVEPGVGRVVDELADKLDKLGDIKL